MVQRPVTPPGAILLGAVRVVTAVAYTMAPATMKIMSRKMSFRRAI